MLASEIAIMESSTPPPRANPFTFTDRVRSSTHPSNLDQMEAFSNVRVEKDHACHVDDDYVVVANHQLLKSPNFLASTRSQQQQQQTYRVLGTLSLIGVSYMATSGGPVGSEPLIATGGPLVGLLSIAVYFLLCQIPISLMVTELCCAFPENGGFAAWAMVAFGPYCGFQVGYWAWVTTTINNAFFPGLIYKTVSNALGVEMVSGVAAYLIKVAIALLLALPSYVGVRFLGVASLIMMAIVVVLTAVFTIWGLSVGDGAFVRLGETRAITDNDHINWTMLVRFLFTNFDRIQWISMVCGEVKNPARTFPRVIFFTTVLAPAVILVSFITTTLGDKTPWRELAPYSYPEIARALGGSSLYSVVIVSSIVTVIGVFANSVFLESFLLQGMAEAKLLPAIFRKRSTRFNTPQFALLASLLAMVVLLGFDFETLLDMTNSFSCAVQIVIVLSMLKLRRAFPNVHRPMRVPGNLVTLALMLLPACVVFFFIIGSTVVNWAVSRYLVAFAVPGLFIPFIYKRIIRRIIRS